MRVKKFSKLPLTCEISLQQGFQNICTAGKAIFHVSLIYFIKKGSYRLNKRPNPGWYGPSIHSVAHLITADHYSNTESYFFCL
jgi:hypothetical protein